MNENEIEFANALMDMVYQFFYHDSDDHDVIKHSFMSAEESAIQVLLDHGLAVEVKPNRYKLNWENLK